MTVRCNQTCPSRAARAILFASLKRNDTLTWDHIAKRNKMVRDMFPNHQFRNNMFHLEIETRNKTVLNGQFGNNVFHSETGTRNKTVLINQFRNSLFHLQIGTRNKTVLKGQFGNYVFHSEIGTRRQNSPNLPI